MDFRLAVARELVEAQAAQSHQLDDKISRDQVVYGSEGRRILDVCVMRLICPVSALGAKWTVYDAAVGVGKGEGKYEVELVPRNSEIEWGELVAGAFLTLLAKMSTGDGVDQ